MLGQKNHFLIIKSDFGIIKYEFRGTHRNVMNRLNVMTSYF